MRAVFLHRPSAESLDRLGALKRFLLFWVPALIGVAIVITESQPTFSAANTSSWLRPIWERLFGPVSSPTWAEFHHILRKSGHFAGYGTLCVLFLRAWLLTLARRPRLTTPAWRWCSWSCAVASTFLVGGGDEVHQSFIPSRTGLFSDVLLDTVGGMIVSGTVLGVSWLLRRLSRKD